MAAAYDGGVVLGADSRTSTGNYVANRVTDKLTQLTDKVAATRLRWDAPTAPCRVPQPLLACAQSQYLCLLGLL